MITYTIIGYIKNSSSIAEVTATTEEQAIKRAGYMLEQENCYKVEIKKIEQ